MVLCQLWMGGVSIRFRVANINVYHNTHFTLILESISHFLIRNI